MLFIENNFNLETKQQVKDLHMLIPLILIECRGNSMDSHRLIHLAGQQDLGKQHDLVEELFLGYFTQGKYIGDR